MSQTGDLTPELEQELEAWLDGELDAAAEARLRRRIDQEPALRRWVDERRRLLAGLGRLPREIPPERDLWPGIAQRMEVAAPRSSAAPVPAVRAFGGRWLLLAASLTATLGIGYLLGRGGPGEPGPETVAESVTTTALPAGLDGGATLVSEAEIALLAAKRELRRALESHRDSLPAETRATVDANLATIEKAIAEIRQAIAANPGDADLRRTLVAYHEREVALLTQVTRAAARL